MLAGLTRIERDPQVAEQLTNIGAGVGFSFVLPTLFHGLLLTPPDGETYLLSMQGSSYHYCSPRENLPRLTDYATVEVAIRAADGEFKPANVLGLALPESDCVYPQVPVDLLCRELTGFCERGGIVLDEGKPPN